MISIDRMTDEDFERHALAILQRELGLDGLARFLVKRGREELSVAFLQRLKEFLEGNVEARTLFPSTVEFLTKIAAYRYSEFLPSLREASAKFSRFYGKFALTKIWASTARCPSS